MFNNVFRKSHRSWDNVEKYSRPQLKCDCTRWRTGEEVPVLFTLPRNMVYPALLPVMCTPRLPVFDWTEAPADLNGLVRFAERGNLVSARVPSQFKRSLQPDKLQMTICRVRISCWIPKAKNTHLECVILTAFPLKMWLHESASMLRYTYIYCLSCLRLISISTVSIIPSMLHTLYPHVCLTRRTNNKSWKPSKKQCSFGKRGGGIGYGSTLV